MELTKLEVRNMTLTKIEYMTEDLILDKNCMSLPVDIIGLATADGFSVYAIDFTKISGEEETKGALLVKSANENHPSVVKQIYFQKDLPLDERRRVIAHEYGHYYLHKNENDDEFYSCFRVERFTNEEARDAAELQAELFARCLLMPKILFMCEYGKLKEKKHLKWIGKSVARYLSGVFNVPEVIVHERLNDLDLHA